MYILKTLEIKVRSWSISIAGLNCHAGKEYLHEASRKTKTHGNSLSGVLSKMMPAGGEGWIQF